MHKLKTFLSTVFVCGLTAVSMGGILPTGKVNASAVGVTEVRPVAEYTFDKTGAEWLNNTGSWGEAYNLQGSTYAKRENWGENSGGVNFSDDSCLYLTGDKYIFNELDSFTIAVDFYATRNANWYSSLLSWDILDETSVTNMSRFSIGYKTGQDWLRYSDVGILGSIAQEGTSYGAFFTKGESLLSQNVDNANSGWWKFIYSVQPGGVAITYLTTGTSNVNYIEVNKVPADYSLKSENGAFSIGAAFKNNTHGIEWKANAILDNLRIYDFAMTETQITELRWTDKVCKSSVTVSSEIMNGSITADKMEALTGELVFLDVQPDEGYEIDKVYVNEMEIQPLDGIYYTKMTKAGVAVYATFKAIEVEEPVIDSEVNSEGSIFEDEQSDRGNSENGESSSQSQASETNGGCFGSTSAALIPAVAVASCLCICKRKEQ